MQKIVITKKDGYSIFGSVNPRTKKLCNFSVKGNNVNENATYTFLSEAESLINHLLKNKK